MTSSVASYPSLVGKTVVISGGGSGIGESITSHFARQGAKVGFLDICDDPSNALVESLTGEGHNVQYINCDVTDTTALQAAIGKISQDFGPVGVLVNNAAHDQRHKLEDVTPDYWDQRIAINIVTTQLPQPDAFIDGPSDGSEVEDELIRRGFQGFQDVPTLFS
ncbi:MAG: SDR family NAD(P)-dependent oxidoreductase, partial [Rhizobiaceae bacterium]|nr:SDR family NAD(P)-dependent oxidoreductase [Rhizobiaceae bacterium]